MSEFKKIDSVLPNTSKVSSSLLEEIEGDAALMKELEGLGIKREEIAHYVPLLSSYLDSKKACEGCKGYSNCPLDTPHFCRYLGIGESGALSSYLGPCHLAKKEMLKESNYLYCDFDSEWKGLTTKGIKTERIKGVLRAILNACKDPSPKRFAYLYGPSGSGKSFILAAVCNDLALKGKGIAFIDVNRRFGELRDYCLRDRERFERTMDTLKRAPILVLDGFGNEYRTETVRDLILLPLLEHRSKNRMTTFFSSEYSLKDIETLYSKSRADALVARRLVGFIQNNIEKETEVPIGLETFFNDR